MIHLNIFYILLIVWLIEIFVYLVQSYVFLTLTKSYVDILYWVCSLLRISCLHQVGYWTL